MPDYIHGILIIKNDRADTSIRPYINSLKIVGVDRCIDPNNNVVNLGKIIQWFKIMVTNNYLKEMKNNNFPSFDKKLFQRNYYERIIKNEKEYWAIKQYIRDNPKKWKNN